MFLQFDRGEKEKKKWGLKMIYLWVDLLHLNLFHPFISRVESPITPWFLIVKLNELGLIKDPNAPKKEDPIATTHQINFII